MNDDDHYNRIQKRKKDALKVLGPLGFVDNEDDEYPGTIYHPGIAQSFDISASEPAAIVNLVFARGKETGVADAKARVRAALGLTTSAAAN